MPIKDRMINRIITKESFDQPAIQHLSINHIIIIINFISIKSIKCLQHTSMIIPIKNNTKKQIFLPFLAIPFPPKCCVYIFKSCGWSHFLLLLLPHVIKKAEPVEAGTAHWNTPAQTSSNVVQPVKYKLECFAAIYAINAPNKDNCIKLLAR